MSNLKRIGILGGTFNPVHLAHLIIAEHFTTEINLDKCIFIPANISPFKINDRTARNTNEVHRMNMLKLAVSYHPKFDTDSYEINKGGVSYTYQTIKHLKNKYPEANLFLLIGSDQAADFEEWKNWKSILRTVQICIARRYARKTFRIEDFPVISKAPIFINVPKIKISSSKIRSFAFKGFSIRTLVPNSVEQYISNNYLYCSLAT